MEKLIVQPEWYMGLPLCAALVANPSGISEDANEFSVVFGTAERCVCCFDTGASHTMISNRLITKLALPEIDGMGYIQGSYDAAMSPMKTYRANIFIPGLDGTNMYLNNHQVGSVASGAIDLLIGQDILRQGTFVQFHSPSGVRIAILPSATDVRDLGIQ